MSPDADPPSDRQDTTEELPVPRERSQFLGAVVVLSGVALVALSSVGLVEFDDSTARLLLLFGSILVLGRQAFGGA